MDEKTTKSNRALLCDEIDIAKMKIEIEQELLKQNLERINKILIQMKITRKIKSCLTYLRFNWANDDANEKHLKRAEKRYKDLSHLYDIAVLERKLLKNKYKQAQQKFTKKLKRIKSFDKKHFSKEEPTGK